MNRNVPTWIIRMQSDPKPGKEAQQLNRGGRRQHFSKKLALLVTTLVFAALLVEVCVRLLYKPAEFAIDSRHYHAEAWPFVYRLLPDQTIFIRIPELDGKGMSVELNHHGFRGDDVDDVAKRGVRIASLGDSFTFGWGLKDFSDQCVVGFVHDYQAAHSEQDVGLSVFAEPGWGPSDYMLAYKKYARQMKPNLVLVGFFCGDDIVGEGTLARINAASAPAKQFVAPPSRLRSAALDWARAKVRDSPVLTKLTLAAGIRPSGDLMRFLRAEPEPMPARWAETLAILTELHELVRADGGQLVILSYPSLIQVYAHQQLNDERFDFRHVDSRLEAFCKQRDIPFVPFLPALMADAKLDLYYPQDRHLTPRGQRLCKQVLLEKLSPMLDLMSNR